VGGGVLMDKQKITESIKSILEAVGADLDREDIKSTPARVADMYEEILYGAKLNPEDELEVILEEDYDELVLLKDIPLYSLCEHHLLPFIGKAHVAYIPDEGRITGLSKLARVVEIFARRLQVQERLTTQIADCIMKKLRPKGVLVVIDGMGDLPHKLLEEKANFACAHIKFAVFSIAIISR